MLKKIFFLTLFLFTSVAFARPGLLDSLGFTNNEETPPLVEEAFQFSAQLVQSDTLAVDWTVLEGNYLYKDKIEFTILDNPDVSINHVSLPDGDNKMDETFGLTEVYHHDVTTLITLERPSSAQTFILKARFQGCSETFGICYPPTESTVSLALPTMIESAKTTTVKATDNPVTVSEQDQIAKKLAEDSLPQILLGFLGLGLLLSFTPCVFPMIPILSSIIVGEGEHITTRRAFILSLIYVLSMSTTYTTAGILTGMLGANLQTMFQTPWIIYSFSLLFVIFAASMFGLFELQLPHVLQHRLHQISHQQQGGHHIGVALMGLLSGLIVGPCLAPPLAGALIFIGQSADPVLGGTALFALSIGMGIPLLIIGTSAGSLLPKAGDWMNTIKSIFGILLLGLAIWMLDRVIPGWLTMLLWGALFIVSAIYIGALNNLDVDANGWEKFWKGIGMILLIYGSLLIIGGASGSHNPWQPLQALANSGSSVETHSSPFTRIQNMGELEAQLAQSKKPVLVDFYADWCTDCKIMEKTTFQDATVRSLLSQFTTLQIDVTQNNEIQQTMLKQLGVFGPPTMLFFDATGKELRDYRLVGLISANKLIEHLGQIANPL